MECSSSNSSRRFHILASALYCVCKLRQVILPRDKIDNVFQIAVNEFSAKSSMKCTAFYYLIDETVFHRSQKGIAQWHWGLFHLANM